VSGTGNGGLSADDSNERIAQPSIDPARIPFDQTAAFRRYGSQFDPDPSDPEDQYTSAIVREQGFDGQPHVVSRAELDQYVLGGEVEIFRGLVGDEQRTAAQYARQFRYGVFFVGRGAYGSGTYTSETLDDARAFADGPDDVVVRKTLKRAARVGAGEALALASRAELRWEIEQLRSGLLVARDEAIRQGNTQAARLAQARYDQGVAIAAGRLSNLGRYAAYLGYDALYFERHGYYLILNRTAVRVQREDL
jgi:hypothetical protein